MAYTALKEKALDYQWEVALGSIPEAIDDEETCYSYEGCTSGCTMAREEEACEAVSNSLEEGEGLGCSLDWQGQKDHYEALGHEEHYRVEALEQAWEVESEGGNLDLP